MRKRPDRKAPQKLLHCRQSLNRASPHQAIGPARGQTYNVIVRAQLSFAVVALFLVLAAASTAAEAPSLAVNDAMVTEGDSGTKSAAFTVSLSAPSSGSVSVDYATDDGSANAPADYESASGTLTFAPGETSKQVVVPVAGDALDEPHETYSVNLSNPSGATLGDARGIGTILDNDPAVSLSVDDVSASEGSGSLAFTVSLSAESGKVITVSYATGDGSAVAQADYAAATGTLVFMPGETEKAVSVPLVADDQVEQDETFTLTLGNAVSGLLADSQGLGTIADDDSDAAPPPPPPPDDPPAQDPPGEDPPAEDPPAEDPPADDPSTDEQPPAQEPPAAPPNAAPDCSAVSPSLPLLWAPNHKFRLVTVGGASDPEGDPLSYEVTAVTQDEPVRRGGDAKRAPEGNQLWLRAERLGKGDGRVYRLEFEASDDHGNSCGGTALVGVPHDRAHPAPVDSGASFDSFGL
jgi:hypothetical protein